MVFPPPGNLCFQLSKIRRGISGVVITRAEENSILRRVQFFSFLICRASLCVQADQVILQPLLPSSHSEARGGSVIVWAAISWNSLISTISLHGRINIKNYLNILGDRVHQMVTPSFTSMLRYIQLNWLRIGMKSMKVSQTTWGSLYNLQISIYAKR